MQYSIDEIFAKDVVCYDLSLKLSGPTRSLIDLTEEVGLGHITETNLPEWEYRLGILNELGITAPDSQQVAMHVGLKTAAENKERDIWISDLQEKDHK